MTKIWAEAFWKGPDEDNPIPDDRRAEPPPARSMIAVSATLALITILVGVFAGPILDLAQRSANELLDTDAYIRAVLGETP